MMRSFLFTLLLLGTLAASGNTEHSFGFVSQHRDSVLSKIQTLIAQDNPYAAKWLADENNIVDEKLNWMISHPKAPWIDSTNADAYIDWKDKLKKIKKPAAKKKYIDSLATLQPQTPDEQYLYALQIAENAFLFKKKIKPEVLFEAIQKEDKTGFDKLNCLLVAHKGYTLLKNKKKLIEIEKNIAALETKYATEELTYYKTALSEMQSRTSEAPVEKIITVEKKEDKTNIFFYLFIATFALALGIVIFSFLKKKTKNQSFEQAKNESERRWLEKENIYNEQLLNTHQQVLELQKQIQALTSQITSLKQENQNFQSRFLDEFDEHMTKIKERFEAVKKNAGVGEVMSLQNDLTRLLAWRSSITK